VEKPVRPARQPASPARSAFWRMIGGRWLDHRKPAEFEAGFYKWSVGYRLNLNNF